MDKWLDAREERINNLKNLMHDDFVYLIIKANTPGMIKQLFSSYFLVRLFRKYIKIKLKIIYDQFFDSFDGPYYIIKTSSNDLKQIKLKMIDIEDNHPLGRFIDIDAYQKDTKSITRGVLKQPPRKCFICDKDAVICSRTKNHTIPELLKVIDVKIIDYIFKDFKRLIDKSITLEAKLHPKFGLVTEKSSGSHPDMDFSLMMNAKNAITDFLGLMVLNGFVFDLDKAFKNSREIGIYAEDNMLTVTSGVNCYKGLIFILGVVCISVGHVIRYNLTKYDIFNCAAYICRDILLEFTGNIDTFGKEAFIKYGFLGIRGEANYGLQSVQSALQVLNEYDDLNDEALTMTLIELVKHCEDTVLLKRAVSIEKYNYFKEKISSIKHYDLDLIEKITNEAINENISIGGAADLLVVTIFIRIVIERYMD